MPGIDVFVSTGKRIRLSRLFKEPSGASLIFAIDHGMTSPTFLRGLEHTDDRIRDAVNGGANVVMAGRAVSARSAGRFGRGASLALMLTASAAESTGGPVVTRIGSVSEALRLAADAVVVYVALGGEQEASMISYLSDIGEECDRSGMPLIAEAEFPDAYSGSSTHDATWATRYLTRNARLCAELGADIVKVNWSGSTESFSEIVTGCGKPVVVAGGPVVSDQELLTRMHQARLVGAIGCSVGRNVFEHADPEGLMRALSRVFEDGWTADDAEQELTDRRAGASRDGKATSRAGRRRGHLDA
jgi:DhnA family fructose-bisphosphate aldolase class Ia